MNPAELTAVLWDAWRAQRGGPAAIARRQNVRLAALVRFARERSPLYRELYRDLPAGDVRLEQLPPVTKPRLMASLKKGFRSMGADALPSAVAGGLRT